MFLHLAAALCTAGVASAGVEGMPLALHVPAALSEEDLAAVHHVKEKTLAELGEGVAHHRSFGKGGGSQTVVFLHTYLDSVAPDLRSKLQSLVQKIDETAGWGIVRGRALRARCAEFILYRAGDAEAEGKIGWHTDGVTLVTLAAMLSEEGDFEGGGSIRIARAGVDGYENYTLTQAGDAIAWRGWSEHAVERIRSGTREVFVTEWWLGPDAAESKILRQSDLPELADQALELEPDSPMLHYLHAKAVCKRLPCQDADAARKAEASFRRALEILPGFERALTGLGCFLLGGSWGQWAEGLARIHDGCLVLASKEGSSLPSWTRWGGGAGCWPDALLVNAVSTYMHWLRPNGEDDEDEDEEEEEAELDAAARKLKHSLWVVVGLAALGGLIRLLERLDGATAGRPASSGAPAEAATNKKGHAASTSAGEGSGCDSRAGASGARSTS